MPFILDRIGVDFPKDIDGCSFLPLITGNGEYNAKYSFSKTHKMNAVRTKDWKLTYYGGDNGGTYELFNLKQDPKELINLYNTKKNAPIVKCLRGELRDILNIKTDLKEPSKEIDRETEEILRSLGYIQ